MSNRFVFFPEASKSKIENASGPLKIKFGIDPTRDRLHLGHFVPLRLCRKLQEQGHHLDLILGTLTAQLGDPSGQDQTRPILSEQEVAQNAQQILKQVEKVLLPGFTVHKNHEFIQSMTIPFFLTTLVSKFTVANMLARDGFRERHSRQQPIALHEFLVPLLQGWDSVHLKSEVEIGGTDQLFNFQVARTLQESEGQKAEMCIMTPIIRGTDGRKMSKTFNNTVWLDETPEDMFGQIMSIPDSVMDEWIDLLTDLRDLPGHPMNRKKLLAENVVSQLLGPEAALKGKTAFENTVQNKSTPDEIQSVKADFLLKIVALVRGESNNKARQLITQGGVLVNGDQIKDPLVFPNVDDVIKIGKRNFVKIVS
jgi:tyrosyl-tRNA synthetase